MRRGLLALLGLAVVGGIVALYLLRPAVSGGPVVGRAAPEIAGRDLATGLTLERLVSGMHGRPFALLFFSYG